MPKINYHFREIKIIHIMILSVLIIKKSAEVKITETDSDPPKQLKSLMYITRIN